MIEAIRQIVLRCFPELTAGLHLDRYGRVLAVSDAPGRDGAGDRADGGSCERFRPRYSVDIEILTPEGERDAEFPVYEAVPLPVDGAGHEAGRYGFPEPGTLVVVGFAYGRPDHPLIRQVYPLGLQLPGVAVGEQRWVQDAAVHQSVDPDGNWTRATDAGITDECLTRALRAVESTVELARELRQVAEHSTEEIGGVKRIEALGGLSIVSGGHANISAADNLNLTTARDLNEAVSGDRNGVVGGNRADTVKGDRTEHVAGSVNEATGGDRTETVGGRSAEDVSGNKEVTAAHVLMSAQTFAFSGRGGVSFLPTVTSFMEEVRDALQVLAAHTHEGTGEIVQGGAVNGHAGAIEGLRGDLGEIGG